MAPKRSNKSTDYSLGLLNNINALGHDAPNIQDPKRRRTTHADIFDIPISPSPTNSRETPQTEPRNTRWMSLRNRKVPELVRSDSPPAFLTMKKTRSLATTNPGQAITNRSGSSGEEELVDDSDELQPEPEHDPFPEPVDLFPAEDEDQADHQVVHETRDAPDDTSGDGPEYEDEEEAGDQAGKEARDAQDNASEDESEYGDEEEADDHSPPEVANENTLEVQILESIPRNQSDGTHISRLSESAREFQNASSQLQEIPEIPTIKPPRPNQDHQSTRPNIFTWLTETIKESVFKDTWEAIRQTRKTLKAHADPSTKEHFRGIIKLIERLRDLFETMTNDPASASSLKNQCSLIANSIFKETQWIVYTEAPENEENGAHLINQLEAHIVPRLIDLIILGFKTYKTVNDRGARHFRIILDLLWGSCDRISSLAQMHYVISGSVMAYSRKVLRHVKTLKDALKDGRLRETTRIPQRPLPYKHFELEEVDSHISCGRWTYAEKIALREGLQLYGGEDRYIDIKCDNTIGGQLSERILQHIQSQAIKLGLDDL
ncbi:hypothetical protein N7517_001851 [Penicillium concentricum]|uniref:Uncharacterized protein n=1 Tax=Penicillium concentricum TaxID=293559 RepID=A0A9W9STN2_9EURO|nr:uncharacterized protein N7517_001851 [Penicillium concentricum]KAJ5383940.1 hypothetical protein N7517_001851 [Penicillium concentricum]